MPERQRCQHLLSLLLQLLSLHALLNLGQEGRAGGGRALQAPLLGELVHLHLQLSVGEAHLLELQLALMQLSGRQQMVVRLVKPKQMRSAHPEPDHVSRSNHRFTEKYRGRNMLDYMRGTQSAELGLRKSYRANSPVSSTDTFPGKKKR